MTTVTGLARAIQTLWSSTADRLARETGFVRRRRKFSGATFAQALVLGWLNEPRATEDQLAQAAAVAGVRVTPRALTKRLGPHAAEFLRRLLAHATAGIVAATPRATPVLRRFAAVVVIDSTTIALPDPLAATWKGCGGSTTQGTAAAVTATLGRDLRSGRLYGPALSHGRDGDLSVPLANTGPAPGRLQIGDLGYFRPRHFAAWGRGGGYWLSRLKTGTTLYDEDGRRLDLPATRRQRGETTLERPVQLGAQERLACRMLAVRVPPEVAARRRARLIHKSERRGDRPSMRALALCDWTILVTNASAELLAVEEALTMSRLRWQIELVFKHWKGQWGLTAWGGTDPDRVLCEVYAKLLGAVIKHWLIVVGTWSEPDRSPTKAGKVISRMALVIGAALGGVQRLAHAIRQVRASLAIGCRMTPRRGKPNAYQLFPCSIGAP